MNAWLEDEEELGFEVRVRADRTVLSHRKAQANSRQLTGRQRQSQQSRYSRRPAPARVSSATCRRNKVRGL